MSSSTKAADNDKAKALQAALAQIDKQFGKGTIMRLGEGEVVADIQVCSTGSLGLDVAPVSYTHLTLPTKRIV